MPLVFADLMTSFSDAAVTGLGSSVAISADGKTVVLGAPFSGSGNGAAYISNRISGVWQPFEFISDILPFPGGELGASVAISENGTVVLIGEPGFTYSDIQDSGSVSSIVNGTFTGRFYASDPLSSASFGTSVAISYNGKTAVVGAPGINSIYIFTRSDLTWVQQDKLIFSTQNFAAFGASISLSADGNTIVTGAPDTSSNQGSAFVFTRSDTMWVQTVLIASDGASGDAFGLSVSVSADASTILIGASTATVNGAQQQGKAYVYKRFDDTWPLQTTIPLTVNGNFPGVWFGQSVALSCNGNIALVGAPSYPTNSPGAIFLFTRTGEQWSSNSSPIQELTTVNLGSSVALSQDGMIAVAGNPGYQQFSIPGSSAIFRCGYDIPNIPCLNVIQGPEGPRGSDGTIGPQGVQGPRGSDGLPGANGSDGATGAQGPQGIQGPAGANLTAHAYLGQIILFSLMLYGGFLLIFFVITFF